MSILCAYSLVFGLFSYSTSAYVVVEISFLWYSYVDRGHRADFNATLDVIEKAFNDQKQRLDAEDSIDLEVQLDVLRKQMEREGL